MGGMRWSERGNGLKEVDLGVGRIRCGCSRLGGVVGYVVRRGVRVYIGRIEGRKCVVMAWWEDSLLVRKGSEGLERG